jgi:RNA polymerase-associated protein CTR9
MAQQRFKYGETMLRKSTEHLAVQTQHENELKAKLEGARRQRQEEKERLDVIQVTLFNCFYPRSSS